MYVASMHGYALQYCATYSLGRHVHLSVRLFSPILSTKNSFCQIRLIEKGLITSEDV